jgi:hypothetical protein
VGRHGGEQSRNRRFSWAVLAEADEGSVFAGDWV